jgi:hypothetical protein
MKQDTSFWQFGKSKPIEDVMQPTSVGNLPQVGTIGSIAGIEGIAPIPGFKSGGLNVIPHSGKMRIDFRRGDAVNGPGDGQSDDIPAMLADGEFVIPADVVSALGNGSTKAGSDALYEMMHSIRARARSAKPKSLPPPAKSPLDYIRKRK